VALSGGPPQQIPQLPDFTVGSGGVARAATRNLGRIGGDPWRIVGEAWLGSGRGGSVRLEA
jgi:hypothetical protein